MTPYVIGLLHGVGGCLFAYGLGLLLVFLAFCHLTRWAR